MLLMFEKSITGGICHAIHHYMKASNIYMKDCDTSKDSSYFMYWDVNNLSGQGMQKILPVDGFEWKKDLFKFDEESTKDYDEDSDQGYILKIDVKYPKEHHELHSDLQFIPEKMKIGKSEKLVCN